MAACQTISHYYYQKREESPFSAAHRRHIPLSASPGKRGSLHKEQSFTRMLRILGLTGSGSATGCGALTAPEGQIFSQRPHSLHLEGKTAI